MPKFPNPDRFRPLAELLRPDIRWSHFHVLEANGARPKTIEDHYAVVNQFSLNAAVPEDVQTHFDTARNLLLHAWYVYRFLSVASMQAYASLEMALRVRLGPPRPSGLSAALKRAVDQGLLFDRDLRHANRLRERQWDVTIDHVVDPESQHFVRQIEKVFPKFRNQWAHGSAGLHGDNYLVLEICCDLINQLFPSSESTA